MPAVQLNAPGYAVPLPRIALFQKLFIVKILIFDSLFYLFGQTVPLLQQGALHLGAAVLTPLACVLALTSKGARAGLWLLVGLRVLDVALTWPYTINHLFLEAVLLAGLAFAEGEPEGAARDQGRALYARWASVLFLSVWWYAGVQKLFHGYYLSGEMFGLEGIADDRGLTLGLSGAVTVLLQGAAAVLGGTVPHVSAAALTDRVDLAMPGWMPIFLVVISSGIVLGELVVPALFLWPRLRRLATVLLGIMQLGIAISSMEIDFAIDNFLFLLLLYPARDPLPAAATAPAPPGLYRSFRAATLGILLAWPVVHMGLASTLDFSSWRFFGWGMYATPDLWHLPAVYVRGADGALAPLTVPPTDPAVLDAYRPVRVFRRPDAVVAYADAALQATNQQAAGPLVVVVTTPRMDVLGGFLYTTNRVYAVEAGQARELGRFSTEAASYDAELQRIAVTSW